MSLKLMEKTDEITILGSKEIEILEVVKNTNPVNYSFFWGALSLISIILLGFFAPSGLILLGFIGVIVTTHEAGHYWAAKKTGIKPTEFFWGFGPEVFSIEKNGCKYGLKALSLGGYVKLEGMNKDSDLPKGFLEEDTFRSASHTARLITILAGPAVNLVTAVITFIGVSLLKGETIAASIKNGFSDTWDVIYFTGVALSNIFTNIGAYIGSVFGDVSEAPTRLMSPVSQSQYSAAMVEGGLTTSLMWFGLLSCAIGAINLLPLPPLDGFHAISALVEGVNRKIFGKKDFSIDAKKFLPIAYMTIGILLLLAVSALIMDLRDPMELQAPV